MPNPLFPGTTIGLPLTDVGTGILHLTFVAHAEPVNYKGEYHYRCGSTRQQLKGAALNDFLLRKTGTRWDAVHLHNVNAENLDGASFDIFRRAAKSRGRLSEEDLKAAPAELLERLHLAENGVLTRAAALLFHPNPDWVNPGCYVKIGRFSKGSNLLYHDEIQGSLIRLADEVIRTLYLKYFKAHITYKNDVRIERYPYPRAAVLQRSCSQQLERQYPYPDSCR